MGKAKFQKKNFIKFIVAILVVAVTLAVVAIYISAIVEEKANPIKMDTGWDIIVNDKIYENQTLSTFVFPENPKKGDVVILENKIPSDITNDLSSIILLIYLTTVDAKVDGQNVYSYGHEEYDAGKLVGSGNHFIQIPPGSGGKNLTIVLQPAEDGAFTNVPVPTYVVSEFAINVFAYSHIVNAFIGIFLFMLGAVVVMMSAMTLAFDKKSLRLLVIGVVAFLIGAWTLCNMKILQIFSADLVRNTFIEYVALFLVPIPLLILLYMVREDEAKWKKVFIFTWIGILIAFVIIAIVLQVTNVAHFPKVLTIFHVLAFCSLILAVIVGRKKFKNMDTSEKLMNIALIVLCVFGGIDILRFNASKYLFPNQELLQDSILPFGTLVFVILLIVSYMFYLYGMVRVEAEKVALSKMAYNDALTGLYNRAKAEDMFVNLVKNKSDYFIINMDLNGLKHANDKYGHEKGDLLLITFAEILEESFKDIGTVIRMGGDEFIIIADISMESKLKPALAKMIGLEAEKSKEINMRIEASFGISSNIEDKSRNPEQVSSVADARMYEMKQKTKAMRRAKAKQNNNKK